MSKGVPQRKSSTPSKLKKAFLNLANKAKITGGKSLVLNNND